jgi:hypothetical protein
MFTVILTVDAPPFMVMQFNYATPRNIWRFDDAILEITVSRPWIVAIALVSQRGHHHYLVIRMAADIAAALAYLPLPLSLIQAILGALGIGVCARDWSVRQGLECAPGIGVVMSSDELKCFT